MRRNKHQSCDWQTSRHATQSMISAKQFALHEVAKERKQQIDFERRKSRIFGNIKWDILKGIKLEMLEEAQGR